MKRRPQLLASVALALSGVACMPPEWGANAILHPTRRALTRHPQIAHESVSFTTADGLALEGWLFRSSAPDRRGLIVYLHGIADNRQSGIGVARRFGPRGWDVLAYDSRGHGTSAGTECTYGFREKRDVSCALDAVSVRGAVLFGSSLGAAVALQAAALDERVRGVIAQSPFSDLESIVRDRAPFIATQREVREALAIAERRANFRVADVSPRLSARAIRVPVLLLHGALDRETRPAHSQRIYDELAGPRQLLLVPGAGHNDTLAPEATWQVIEEWLEEVARPVRQPG